MRLRSLVFVDCCVGVVHVVRCSCVAGLCVFVALSSFCLCCYCCGVCLLSVVFLHRHDCVVACVCGFVRFVLLIYIRVLSLHCLCLCVVFDVLGWSCVVVARL